MEILLDPPIQFITTTNINRYTYHLFNLVLNKEITLIIDLYSNQKQVTQIVRKIEGQEYQDWINDAYILEIVKAEVEKLRTPV